MIVSKRHLVTIFPIKVENQVSLLALIFLIGPHVKKAHSWAPRKRRSKTTMNRSTISTSKIELNSMLIKIKCFILYNQHRSPPNYQGLPDLRANFKKTNACIESAEEEEGRLMFKFSGTWICFVSHRTCYRSNYLRSGPHGRAVKSAVS